MRMDIVKSWDVVTEKIKSILSSWHAKCLSAGGILTLLKLVLGSLLFYYFFLFRVPASLNRTLGSLRSNCFWGAKELRMWKDNWALDNNLESVCPC